MVLITKSHHNYSSVGVTELCLSNLLILIDCFLCNSYPCVLFESLSHVINQESHVYSWNLGKIYLVHFLKFWNLPRFTREISKFQKSELGKFIPNFPLKHVITSTNSFIIMTIIDVIWFSRMNFKMLLLKILMYLDFLIWGSRVFHSFVVEGKSQFLKKPCFVQSWRKFSKFREKYLWFGDKSSWKRYLIPASLLSYFFSGSSSYCACNC